MKVLVTGAAGFIGSRISIAAASKGMQVVGLDCLTDYYDPRLKASNVTEIMEHGVDLVERDINDPTLDLRTILDGVDYVFHQAGQPGVRSSWGDDFALYTQRNIAATQRLLEAAKGSDHLSRFVYASSSSIYGDAESYPTSEDVVPSPISPYGVTKLAAEHLATLYATNFGVPTVSLRYFTVFGPGQRPDMAFTRFVNAAIQGTPIDVYGSGNQVRDFTFVDDVVNANFLAAEKTQINGRVYNVAGGTSVSVNEVLDMIGRISGKPLDIRRVAAVAGDVARTGGDTGRIQVEIGWDAKTSLEVGLTAQLTWAESLSQAKISSRDYRLER